MNVFKMMKQAMSLKSKMKDLHAAIAQRTIETRHEGITIVISGDLKRASCRISPDEVAKGAEPLSVVMSQAIEKAITNTKKAAVEEMKKEFSGMDLDGLLDML